VSAAAAPAGPRVPARIFVFIGGRNIARNVRAPMLLAVSLAQPLAWLALFSQTFRGLAADPAFRALGYRNYLTFFTSGMLVLSMLFTALQSGMATMTDIDTGMMDKLLTSPVPRAAILAGRVWADLWTMLAQGIVIELAAAAMGARFATGAGGALLLLAYGTAFGVIWAAVPNLIALRTRSAELTMALGFFLTLPVLFMSSAFFPLRLQPGWLQAIARANPAAYVITTGQALLNSGYQPGQQARTAIALAVTAAVLVPATVASFRSIKELSRMPVIDVRGLTKRFGAVTAVDDLSFSVGEGTVTAFLGPNGAGKTTTLRMLLGLVRPSAGTAVINGRPYRDVRDSVGASLEAAGFHPGRTGRGHLRARALARGADGSQADSLLAMVDLTASADSRIGTYSLGMRQRLGLAAAMIGDPQVLILDEPANGLDPEGVRWLRGFLRGLAAEGRTILVSSHLLAEVAQTASHAVIISQGRLMAAGPITDLTRENATLEDLFLSLTGKEGAR
jgi:ABC-2 type transport system ATP-binding protein